MSTKPNFLRNKLAAGVSLALAASSTGYVQAAGPVEEVIATGIRGSLMRAQAIKQDSSSVVEALSAEDIGKLPDTSIAESLARLPGMAGNRSGGRVSGISVRGFKEDFTGTSLNGRELIGIGDNRGVEYDLYPAEIMTGAVIYKTADAALTTQGLGGTVDLTTVRPLDATRTLSITGVLEQESLGSDNPDYSDDGHRIALSFVDQFADDTIGVALTYADTESPTNQQSYGVWGYTETGGAIVPTGLETFVQSKELARETISAILQFQPNDRLDIVVDYLDIDFSDSGVIRGLVGPISVAGVSGSGADNTGTWVGANPVVRSDPDITAGTLESYGLNVKFNLNDSWTAMVDVANSESFKNFQRAEGYAGIGRDGSLTAADLAELDFAMSGSGVMFTAIDSDVDFDDFDAVKLTGPQQWGGGLAAEADKFTSTVLTTLGTPYSYLNAQDGFWNTADFTEELTTARFELQGEIEFGIINKLTAGVNYSDREKTKDNDGFFATAPTYPFGAGTGIVDDVIPEQYRSGLADLSFVGLGSLVAWDGFAPYQDGFYDLTDAGTLEPDRLGDTYIVEEEVFTYYFKADWQTDISGYNVFGNVGFQVVYSDQSSSGFIGIVDDTLSVCRDGDAIAADCIITDGVSYTDLLPSLNINIELSEDSYLRFAASKTQSRARIDQMKASGFVKFEQNIDLIAIPNSIAAVDEFGTPWSKTQGTPTLRPLESNNYDLSYEKYFEEDGYFAVSVFYKDLVNWHRDAGDTIDFTNDETNDGANYFIPGFHDRIAPVDDLYGPADIFYAAGDLITPPSFGNFAFFEDGLSGDLSGVEVTANVPLRVFSDALDGFGLAGSATYIDGELDNDTRIPGQSDEIYSLTAYWESSGFEVRIAATDRSDYLTYQRGGSNKIEEATRAGDTIVDAQISYDFADSSNEYLAGLRISLQGTNLTEEGETITDDNTGLPTRIREFGAVYLLNVNYAFY